MALTPGSPFPDLVLPDHSGYERSLAELVAGDPPRVQAAFRAGLGASSRT
jgi:hypothetical protein